MAQLCTLMVSHGASVQYDGILHNHIVNGVDHNGVGSVLVRYYIKSGSASYSPYHCVFRTQGENDNNNNNNNYNPVCLRSILISFLHLFVSSMSLLTSVSRNYFCVSLYTLPFVLHVLPSSYASICPFRKM